MRSHEDAKKDISIDVGRWNPESQSYEFAGHGAVQHDTGLFVGYVEDGEGNEVKGLYTLLAGPDQYVTNKGEEYHTYASDEA